MLEYLKKTSSIKRVDKMLYNIVAVNKLSGTRLLLNQEGFGYNTRERVYEEKETWKSKFPKSNFFYLITTEEAINVSL